MFELHTDNTEDSFDVILNAISKNKSLELPSFEDVLLLRNIDNLITGTKYELIRALSLVEDKVLSRFPFLYMDSFENYIGSDLALLPEVNNDEFVKLDKIMTLYDFRKSVVEKIFNSLGANISYRINDGGIKSVKRAVEKANNNKRIVGVEHVPDLVRFRVVVNDLVDLPRLYNSVSECKLFKLIGLWNLFLQKECNPYDTDFKAFITSWVDLTFGEYAMEIQFLTVASNAIASLNHPFDIARVLEYPNIDAKHFIEKLLLKVAIFDYLNSSI